MFSKKKSQSERETAPLFTAEFSFPDLAFLPVSFRSGAGSYCVSFLLSASFIFLCKQFKQWATRIKFSLFLCFFFLKSQRKTRAVPKGDIPFLGERGGTTAFVFLSNRLSCKQWLALPSHFDVGKHTFPANVPLWEINKSIARGRLVSLSLEWELSNLGHICLKQDCLRCSQRQE